MPELLVVRLHPIAAASSGATQAAPPQAEWLVIDSSGARRGNVSWGSLSDAAEHSQTRKTIVLVPGTDVLLAEPTLPLKGGAKLAQVVPFALEEQLAADVEDILAREGFEAADYIISGLPFSTLPPEVADEIAAATARAIRPGGKFLVYQYSRFVLSRLERFFGHVDQDIVWRCIPPARLFWACKDQEQGATVELSGAESLAAV